MGDTTVIEKDYLFIRWERDGVECMKNVGQENDFSKMIQHKLRREHLSLLHRIGYFEKSFFESWKTWLSYHADMLKINLLDKKEYDATTRSIQYYCEEGYMKAQKYFIIDSIKEKGIYLKKNPWLKNFLEVFEISFIKWYPIPKGVILFEGQGGLDDLTFCEHDESEFTTGSIIERKSIFSVSWHPEPACRFIGKKNRTQNKILIAHHIESSDVRGLLSQVFHPERNELDVTLESGLKNKIVEHFTIDIPYYCNNNEGYKTLTNVHVYVAQLYK